MMKFPIGPTTFPAMKKEIGVECVVRMSKGWRWRSVKISVYIDRVNVEVQDRAFEGFLVCFSCN